ncbi:MAG: hypothetical protein Ta2A_16300 [Treponemataceae bacterium]|nr:MAG: hypothetical protein Ta2A_16300 [Treponemataceae bacterium]
MTVEFRNEMQDFLNAQRKELIDSLLEANSAFRDLVKDGAEIGDTIDEAAGVIDRKIMEAIGAKDMNTLQLIDSALSRIRQDKYGICMKCNKSIPEERLRAIPYAIMCIDCKSADERRNR